MPETCMHGGFLGHAHCAFRVNYSVHHRRAGNRSLNFSSQTMFRRVQMFGQHSHEQGSTEFLFSA